MVKSVREATASPCPPRRKEREVGKGKHEEEEDDE
jgi:hypothetical protein